MTEQSEQHTSSGDIGHQNSRQKMTLNGDTANCQKSEFKTDAKNIVHHFTLQAPRHSEEAIKERANIQASVQIP